MKYFVLFVVVLLGILVYRTVAWDWSEPTIDQFKKLLVNARK